jgi:hypothetical protein
VEAGSHSTSQLTSSDTALLEWQDRRLTLLEAKMQDLETQRM